MEPRMTHPAYTVPGAADALQALSGAAAGTGLDPKLLELVNLRASQINGCSVCVDGHWRLARRHGESDERLFAVGAWREAPYFTDAERAALALTEAATRMSDRGDAVSDEVWNEAAKHYNEEALAVLVTQIAMINFWNRINCATQQIAGQWNA